MKELDVYICFRETDDFKAPIITNYPKSCYKILQ